MDEANKGVPPQVGVTKTRLSHVERAKRRARIPELFTQGWSDERIAKELRLSPGTVCFYRSKLGLSRKCGRKRGSRLSAFWRNLDDERTQRIIAMVKQGRMPKEIGQALGGLTRQYVHQLLANIQRAHGDDVLKPDKQWFTAQAAARALGIYPELVSQLCRNGDIPYSQRSETSKIRFILDAQGIEALRIHPRVTREKTCCVCGKPFRISRTSTWGRISCSPECRRERRRRLQLMEASLDSLEGWHRQLWQELPKRTIPSNEKWIGIGEAVVKSGLSTMQLNYMALGEILTTRRHPTKEWRGKPMRLYATSQVKLAGRIFRAWQRKQKRRKKKQSP